VPAQGAFEDLGQLLAAIRAVAEGGSVIDPKVVEALVAEKTRGDDSPLNELTRRERDVLCEMAEEETTRPSPTRST
jgi:DNA-binding NarL/FixJ family response regulator